MPGVYPFDTMTKNPFQNDPSPEESEPQPSNSTFDFHAALLSGEGFGVESGEIRAQQRICDRIQGIHRKIREATSLPVSLDAVCAYCDYVSNGIERRLIEKIRDISTPDNFAAARRHSVYSISSSLRYANEAFPEDLISDQCPSLWEVDFETLVPLLVEACHQRGAKTYGDISTALDSVLQECLKQDILYLTEVTTGISTTLVGFQEHPDVYHYKGREVYLDTESSKNLSFDKVRQDEEQAFAVHEGYLRQLESDIEDLREGEFEVLPWSAHSTSLRPTRTQVYEQAKQLGAQHSVQLERSMALEAVESVMTVVEGISPRDAFHAAHQDALERLIRKSRRQKKASRFLAPRMQTGIDQERALIKALNLHKQWVLRTLQG